MSNRKIVKGIPTTGLTEREYKQIYRQKTVEASVKKTLDLGKFDSDFAKKLVDAMKSDPRTRRMIALIYIMGIYTGLTKFTVDTAVTHLIRALFLSQL